jgi:hypothetical protein
VNRQLVVVPGEAETVRTIFARYLELGSVRTLAEDLDRRGIRSKTRQFANGRTIGGGRFGVGALAYLLKNRFYIGEVAYRGEVHRGGHAPILDRALFEAVQEKLNAQAVERRCRLQGASALLAGRLFDDHGNRMTPTHTNKGGARYRYYVSQAALQNKPAGSIVRVPAPQIEALVIAAVRDHLRGSGIAPSSIPDNARQLIERHVERVTLTSRNVELQLRPRGEAAVAIDADDAGTGAAQPNASLTIAWTLPDPTAIKGVVHVPSHNTPMTPSRRDALLVAIAKARQWVDDVAHGRAASFAAIARREGKAERHVRRMAPLAFLSPRIVAAILYGTAPECLTASALPWSWADQERQVGVEAGAPADGCSGQH